MGRTVRVFGGALFVEERAGRDTDSEDGRLHRFEVVRFEQVMAANVTKDEEIFVSYVHGHNVFDVTGTGYLANEILEIIAQGVQDSLAPQIVQVEPYNWEHNERPVEAGDLYDRVGEKIKTGTFEPPVMPPMIGEKVWKDAMPKLIGEPLPWSKQRDTPVGDDPPTNVDLSGPGVNIHARLDQVIDDIRHQRDPAARFNDPPADIPHNEAVAGGYGPGDVPDCHRQSGCPADRHLIGCPAHPGFVL